MTHIDNHLLTVASRIGTAAALALLAAGPTQADQVINDDLIVKFSECIGMDCVNGESFGFDTLRLKENNLRIKFDDTSNSASFPNWDWQLTANDSTNGGQNKFSIDDITAGRTPFTIEGSAPANSLYVDDGGRVGFGTSTPSLELHVVDGDSPALRLQQDGSSGFTPQIWDIVGNEASFFVRDVTNGSKLAFRIRPNAPASSIDIKGTTGDVGFGTSSPSAPIHVRRTDGTARIYVEEASATLQDRDLLTLANKGGARLILVNNDNNVTWRLGSEDSDDDFIITRDGSGQLELRLTKDGDLYLPAGQVMTSSDRNRKYNIKPIDEQEILSKLAKLPVTQWTYTSEPEDVKHIGPMAQDFAATFDLGKDSRSIGNLDIAGVALASIKALKAGNDSASAEIAQLRQQNQHLLERISRLEAKLAN